MNKIRSNLFLISLLSVTLLAACEQAKVTDSSKQEVPAVTTPSEKISKPVAARPVSLPAPIIHHAENDLKRPFQQKRAERQAKRKQKILKKRRWWNDDQYGDLAINEAQKMQMEAKLALLTQEEQPLSLRQKEINQQTKDAMQNKDINLLMLAMEQRESLNYERRQLQLARASQVVQLLSPEQRSMLMENPNQLRRILKSFKKNINGRSRLKNQ